MCKVNNSEIGFASYLLKTDPFDSVDTVFCSLHAFYIYVFLWFTIQHRLQVLFGDFDYYRFKQTVSVLTAVFLYIFSYIYIGYRNFYMIHIFKHSVF